MKKIAIGFVVIVIFLFLSGCNNDNIGLIGGNIIEIEVGTSYSEPGVNMPDGYTFTSTSIDISSVGSFTISYNIIDDKGNAVEELIRIVNVVDTTSPTINMNNVERRLEIGENYEAPVVTVNDNYDLIDELDLTINGEVDINRTGTYTIIYQVVDSSGNESEVLTQVVKVIDYTLEFTLTLLLDGTYEITGYIGTEQDVYIPSSIGGIAVTSIGDGAFDGKQLTSIIISEGIQSIGDNALSHNKLTSLYIPSTVISMGWSPFNDNPIAEYTVSDNNPYFTSIDGVMFSKDLKTLVYFTEVSTRIIYTIPEGTTIIGENAFAQSNLTSVDLPASLVRIERAAFIGHNLLSITIPSSVEFIGYQAFDYGSLETLIIEDGVKHIGTSFAHNNLTTVYIPASVETIDGQPFREQNGDLQIYVSASSKPAGWGEEWNPDGYSVIWGYNTN